jgi:competence protein ComEA
VEEAGRALRGEAGRVAERTRAVLAGAVDPAVDDDVVGWVDDPEAGPAAGLPTAARHRRPPGWPVFDGLRDRLRWDPGRRGAAAVAALALVAVVVTVWQVARSRPQPVSIQTGAGGLGSAAAGIAGGPDGLRSPSVPVVGGPAPAATGMPAVPVSPPPGVVVVDVAGRVRSPGVYRLRAGSRVFDALRAAGGARRSRDTAALNLAAPVTDGQQILVGLPAGPAGSAMSTGPPPSGTASAVAQVDLNTATLEQLETLPGVGPVLGQNILDWRAAHGSFSSLAQLRDVTGIGDVRFAQLGPLVTLS